MNPQQKSDAAERVALEEAWAALEAGTKSGSPFNLLQLATVSTANRPRVRTIVLRQCRRAVRQLFFVSDSRSLKLRDIAHQSEVSLVAYDPASWTQLRLSGRAQIEADEVERQAQWERLSERTRRSFDTPVEPGTLVTTDGKSGKYPEQDGSTPFDRFALIKVELWCMEHLNISQEDHLRFQFHWNDGCWRSIRLTSG
jgi:hypothetical protein